MTRNSRIRPSLKRIEPTTQNGTDGPSWALAHHVTSVSLKRIERTNSSITAHQLAQIRERIALALGID
ncbi:MAG: type II toxin-antitoxin system PemK/MazF family toxin [Candidatus Baltobacteraceae bacterium]